MLWWVSWFVVVFLRCLVVISGGGSIGLFCWMR